MDKIREAQWLLYKWLGCFEKRKEESIRQQCEYLNENMGLGIKSKPVWVLFYPLVYTGVAEFAGNGYYALTSPLAIQYGDKVLTVNEGFKINDSFPIGFGCKDKHSILKETKVIQPNPLSVLRAIPSLDETIDKWPEGNVSTKSLIFSDKQNKRGLADLEDGLRRFFCIPDKYYIKEVPSRAVNPEAYNIANCYTRVVNNKANGEYDKRKCVLKVQMFAFPILLYRVLMLEGLKNGQFPKEEQGMIFFYNISQQIFKELNTILNKSITERNIESIPFSKPIETLKEKRDNTTVESSTANISAKQIDYPTHTVENIKEETRQDGVVIVTQYVTEFEFKAISQFKIDEYQFFINEIDRGNSYIEWYLNTGSFKYRHVDQVKFVNKDNWCIRRVQSINLSAGKGEFSQNLYIKITLMK